MVARGAPPARASISTLPVDLGFLVPLSRVGLQEPGQAPSPAPPIAYVESAVSSLDSREERKVSTKVGACGGILKGFFYPAPAAQRFRRGEWMLAEAPVCEAPKLAAADESAASAASVVATMADEWLEQLKLLAALARSPCTLAITGKGQQYWQRMENACWRSHSLRQHQRPRSTQWHHGQDAPLLEGIESLVPPVVAATGRRARKWLRGRNRRSAAALLKVQRLKASVPLPPSIASPAVAALPVDAGTVRQLLQSVGTQMINRAHRSRKALRRSANGMRRPSVPPQRALPHGHPLLLPPSEVERLTELDYQVIDSPLMRHLSNGRQTAPVSGGSSSADGSRPHDAATGAPAVVALDSTTFALDFDIELEAELLELRRRHEVAAAAAAAAASPHQSRESLSLAQSLGLGFGCGGISGVVARAVVHPLDTLRVLQSVSSTDPSAEILRESPAEVNRWQRLSAARSHWAATATRAVRDGRHLLSSAYHNWHLGPTSNPLYDTQQLMRSVRILYRGYALSVTRPRP